MTIEISKVERENLAVRNPDELNRHTTRHEEPMGRIEV